MRFAAWLQLLAGYGADLLLGDQRRAHPVAALGKLVAALERLLYAPSRRRGALFAAIPVALSGLLGALAQRLPAGALLVMWTALGGRSLNAEARALATSLRRGELEEARRRLPALAGRDPQTLDGTQIARAVVESVAENTGDAVCGPLVWFALAGPAGAAAYRAANTLDAMVGHRSERYERFGWAAARLDDLLSWPGARLGALLAVACAAPLGARPGAALTTLRRDGRRHPSPNAGRLEAAFAGALGVRLGGELSYGGRRELRPSLGDGQPPDPGTIERATQLSAAVGAASAALCATACALAGGPLLSRLAGRARSFR
jgi:adenosylcobinamide-phosphate synthase